MGRNPIKNWMREAFAKGDEERVRLASPDAYRILCESKPVKASKGTKTVKNELYTVTNDAD